MNSPLEIEIRPYTLEDAPAVWEAVRESLPELKPWMPWCHEQYSIEESRTWLEVQVPAFLDGSAFEFAIVTADGGYLGGCGLNQIDTINKRGNLAYWVRSAATRRGVATAAVGLLCAWGFRHTALVRLELVIAVETVASQRVARKAEQSSKAPCASGFGCMGWRTMRPCFRSHEQRLLMAGLHLNTRLERILANAA